jgi:hypothetical protein
MFRFGLDVIAVPAALVLSQNAVLAAPIKVRRE